MAFWKLLLWKRLGLLPDFVFRRFYQSKKLKRLHAGHCDQYLAHGTRGAFRFRRRRRLPTRKEKVEGIARRRLQEHLCREIDEDMEREQQTTSSSGRESDEFLISGEAVSSDHHEVSENWNNDRHEDSSQARLADESESSTQCKTVGESAEVQSSLQQLIPGVPDDLTVQCLARLSYKQRAISKAVNSQWMETLSSLEFHSTMSAHSRLVPHLCILQLARSVTGARLSLVPRLYHPVHATWHCLPPLALWAGPGVLIDFEPVACGTHLLVLGGSGHLGHEPGTLAGPGLASEDSERFRAVSRFNVPAGRWEVGPMMNNERTDFVAGVIGTRIFVADGAENHPPEVLDMAKKPQKWLVLKDYVVNKSLSVEGSFTKGDRLYIVRRGSAYGLSLLADVYDSRSDSWHTERDFCGPENQVVRMSGRSFAVVEGHVYGMFMRPSQTRVFPETLLIRRLDEPTRKWKIVAEYTQARQFESMEHLTQLQLVAVKDRLFVISCGECHDRSAVSFMSILHIRGLERKAVWEASGVQIRDVFGESSQAFGALCLSV